MERHTMNIGETGKAILQALNVFGKNATFSQILAKAGLSYDNSRQVEIALSLESMGLIHSVTYSLPLEIRAELTIQRHHIAPNGFLHAGTVVTLADTACGYGCIAHLPEGAKGFTTIELKSNFLGTAREGAIACVATSQHLGRTTQIWDAVVTHKESGRTLALFRCTQLVIHAKP